jgi:hypothetical protein
MDVIVMWVDNSSPVFVKNWRIVFESKVIPNKYKSSGEIVHCLNSLEYLNGRVRDIILVTDGTVLETSDLSLWTRSKLRYVFHDEFLPKSLLPTFSSHIIESFIHNIPDISEDYLLFNDDCFLLREIDISRYFDYDGLARIVLSKVSLSEVSEWNAILRPTLDLLASKFNFPNYYQNPHTPFLFNRGSCDQVSKFFELEHSLGSKPKVNSDLTLNFRLLYIYWLINTRMKVGDPRERDFASHRFSTKSDVLSIESLNFRNFERIKKLIANSKPTILNVQKVEYSSLLTSVMIRE